MIIIKITVTIAKIGNDKKTYVYFKKIGKAPKLKML